MVVFWWPTSTSAETMPVCILSNWSNETSNIYSMIYDDICHVVPPIFKGYDSKNEQHSNTFVEPKLDPVDPSLLHRSHHSWTFDGVPWDHFLVDTIHTIWYPPASEWCWRSKLWGWAPRLQWNAPKPSASRWDDKWECGRAKYVCIYIYIYVHKYMIIYLGAGQNL